MILRLYNCDNATVDLRENVAVLELARHEIFMNVLLDFTEQVFPARELAVDSGKDLLDSNDIICIRDYFDLSLKNKTLLNKLYKHVDSTVFSDPEERMNLENLISRLKQYFLDVLRCLNVDLDVSPETDVKNICAMIGLVPFCAEEGIAAKLEQYITICAELKLCKVLVLVQVKAYLSSEELEMIYRCALRNRIGLILVESVHREGKLFSEKKIFIDEDFSDIIF